MAYPLAIALSGMSGWAAVSSLCAIVMLPTSLKEFPDVVREGLSTSRYAKARVLKIEKVTNSDKEEAPSYELLVEHDRKKHEIVFCSTGELTKEEAKSQHEN